MKIDVHNHFLPESVVDFIRVHGDKLNTEIVVKGGAEHIAHKEGAVYPNFPEFHDYDRKAADLDKMGLDMAVLSASPMCFYYWVSADAALEVCRLCNDWVSDFSKKHSDRFRGMAMLPMQDVQLAMTELRRAHERLGLRALSIAPIINDLQLDEACFNPVYEYCEANNILLYLHPSLVEVGNRLTKYYNTNLIGNVLETNIGINHLIFGGAFERFPGLRVFTSHGGGYFPYQMGRLRHGYSVRQEPRVNIRRSPEQYANNLYFDTITHWSAALQFLVDQFGADHVMLGTDYPYDMGDYKPVEHVSELRLTGKQRALILSGNAKKLLGL